MKIASGGTRPLLAAILAFGIIQADAFAAEEPPAVSFIRPTTDKQCDEFNRSWVVANQHTYLSIKVRVRWSAVGAKQMEEEILLAPGGARAIGCASELEIVWAELMQF